MAIVENRASEIGDILYIRAEVPIVGLLFLFDFMDSTTGETASKFFTRQFRYSRDGFNFTSWQLLTTENVENVDVNPIDTFIVEYRYTRSGTDASGELAFEDVLLTGETQLVECGEAYNNSIFSQFFTCVDLCVLNWSINVLEKIYKKGLVPEAIERGKVPEEDRDFIDYFRTFTTFFGYLVCYARKFQNFSQITSLLSEYLSQRGLYLGDSLNTQKDLNYLKKNYYREISYRGTKKMLREKSENEPMGEFLRLIQKKEEEAFLFSLTDNKFISWNIGNSSPLYKGVQTQKNISLWEDTKDFIIPLKTPTVGITSIVGDGDRQVLFIEDVANSITNGIGYDLRKTVPIDYSKAVKVDSKFSYKISFEIKQPNVNSENLTFGVLGLDKDNNIKHLKSCLTGSFNSTFFRKKKLNKANQWYYIEGYVYYQDISLFTTLDGTCNIGFGQDLILSESITKIIPYLVIESDTGIDSDNGAYIWDFKITPAETFSSTAVIDKKNIFKMWYRNNNKSLFNSQIEDSIRRYFIPYNSSLITSETTDKRYPPRLPEFDFAIVKYSWGVGGSDLDTRTAILGTGSAFDGQDVGWSRNNIIGTSNKPYLRHGGDNTGEEATEAILVDFKKITEDFSVKQFDIRLRAFWYGRRDTGDITVKLETYLGGVMQQQGTDFINIGGQLVTSLQVQRNLLTQNSSDIDGDEVGLITYFSQSKSAILN